MPNLPDLIGNEFFSIDLKAYNRFENAFRQAIARIPEVAERETREWAGETRIKLKAEPYPPKRSGQKYKRTGRLANSWRKRDIPRGATIMNTAHRRGRFYSRYVVGNATGAGQARIHKGKNRWWTGRSIVDRELPKLIDRLVIELRKEIEGTP